MKQELFLVSTLLFHRIYSFIKHINKLIILLLFISFQYVFPQTPLDTTEYYPLKVGNYWEYWSYDYSINRLITGDTLMPNGKKYFIIRMEESDIPGYYWYWYHRNDGIKTYQYSGYASCSDKEFIYYDFSSPDSTIWPICQVSNGAYRSCVTTQNYYSPIFNKTIEIKSMVSAYVVGTDTIYDPMGPIAGREFIGKNVGLMEMVEEAAGVFFLQGAILNGQKYGTITGIKNSVTKSQITNPLQLKIYPNPFNNSAQIIFTLPKTSNIQIKIFNIIGEEIYEITNGEYNAGEHQIYFNSSRIASGFYILTLRTENEFLSKKIIILK
jgi:hypothetical protein